MYKLELNKCTPVKDSRRGGELTSWSTVLETREGIWLGQGGINTGIMINQNKTSLGYKNKKK